MMAYFENLEISSMRIGKTSLIHGYLENFSDSPNFNKNLQDFSNYPDSKGYGYLGNFPKISQMLIRIEKILRFPKLLLKSREIY